MNLKKLVEKYEARNESRVESIKEGQPRHIKQLLLTLHIETEEFIQDLKILYKN